MREHIVGLLEKADIAIGSSVGVVSEGDLEKAARAVLNARVRLSYPDEVLVAALVGGTGSGKSSLANAICQSEAAEIGGMRPTTDQPLALVPHGAESSISGYLDQMGVSRRKPQDVAEWLCLIDMPDIDSVELDNRMRVDQLLPRLDVIVWVLDPEKYRDASIHNRYLRPLSSYAGQFVFVLNQADRLRPDEIDGVAHDLQLALTEDGIDSGTTFVTAANPPIGPPTGVEELVDHLERLSTTRTGCYQKLLVDLEQAASSLLAATGGTGLDFEARAARVLDESAGLIAEGRPGEAVNLVKAALESLAGEAGGPVEDRILDVVYTVPGAVQSALDQANAIAGERERKLIRWSEPPPQPAREMRADAAASTIDRMVIAPVREALAARAAANAALTDMALSVADLKSRADR